MKIFFKYSEKMEQLVIKYFQEHQDYENNLIIPENHQIKKPINPIFLKKILSEVQEKWFRIEKHFLRYLQDLRFNIPPKFICYLSRYGSSGFYLPPNKLIIRIVNPDDLRETNINIAHELVHLILKHNGKDKNLNYIEREKMIDDILTGRNAIKFLPDYKKQDFS